MQTREELGYDVHILVCVNERTVGSCCKNVHGQETFLGLKRWVAENGLVRCVWVTRTVCLGFCNDVGANVVIYPAGRWFLHTTPDTLNQVIDEVKKLLAH